MISCQSQVDTTSLVVGPIDNNLAMFGGLCNDKSETKQDVRYICIYIWKDWLLCWIFVLYKMDNFWDRHSLGVSAICDMKDRTGTPCT